MERGLVADGEGRPLGPETPYRAHLRVSYFREVEAEALPAEEIDVLHLDDHLVVADKPPFLPVTPGGRVVRGCLLYLLEEQLGLEGLAPVHRLDRDTSGVVLFARRAEDRGAYGELFAKNKVRRVYEAMAEAPIEPPKRKLRVESRIVPGSPFFRMEEAAGPPNAVTGIELLSWSAGRGLFELRPETGKKHQLRLHMAGLGWPILGDRLYPRLLPEAPDEPANPLHLVAKRLTFPDPVTGHERRFESRRRDLTCRFKSR